ncbi:helix-turn-helix domain-containing protein [Verrucomicrobiaceae bacterium N1E253]|uniref:Helix-turn-helix domain-containing protein n=1 Tax=Oceaniferula marina TaxID=2748318 RepID=A0A851GEN9_9BACT|nr:helix-turn-helix domain-containing protein [Oceaniferula marina]NWK55649.1 helix-turn-helix domain-containing protein [Oceaniferula marina]
MKNNGFSMRREWIRPAEVREIFGIGRTTLYALMKKGVIVNKSLKEPGQRAATRLINYDSISDYIEGLPE